MLFRQKPPRLGRPGHSDRNKKKNRIRRAAVHGGFGHTETRSALRGPAVRPPQVAHTCPLCTPFRLPPRCKASAGGHAGRTCVPQCHRAWRGPRRGSEPRPGPRFRAKLHEKTAAF
jgi:hypothetical protein